MYVYINHDSNLSKESSLEIDNGDITPGDELKGTFVKGFLEFETEKNEEIYVKMGVSTVSSENALENLTEIITRILKKLKLNASNLYMKKVKG